MKYRSVAKMTMSIMWQESLTLLGIQNLEYGPGKQCV